MRPGTGHEALPGRIRLGDNESPLTGQPERPQMTYFLADEATVDASLQNQTFPPPYRPRKSPHDEGPVAGAGTGPGPGPASPASPTNGRESRPTSSKGLADILRYEDGLISRPDSPVGKMSLASNPPVSQPLTPILLGQSGPTSASSCISSRRGSFVGSISEDIASQAPSGFDGVEKAAVSSSMTDSGSAPQLVMPSIKMPSRRPFTAEGKSMGRLKVLVAGDSGVGKTSLIKAVVQACEHIVHVDPITPPTMSLTLTPKARGRRPSTRVESGTAQITEIYASTKPYPEWWSDLDEAQVLPRRKSLGDTVLDRNICFVDTPGFSRGSSAMDIIQPVVQYTSSHLSRMYSDSLSDSEVLNMLGGDGGAQVDVVFYIIRNEVKPADIQYLQLLSPLTNVIPVLAQADLLDAGQLAECKAKVEGQLQEASIRAFSFSVSSVGSNASAEQKLPYAVSSATGNDHDNMDASLLMSADYVQPLVPSDLAVLVEQVFSHRGASWLRYAAARKYIQWRKTEKATKPMDLYRPLGPPTRWTGGPEQHRALIPGIGSPTSFALARIADHTQREARLAQIRLSNWAAELQKSLANERAQYEALAQRERALWLTERLNECAHDEMGTLIALRSSRRSPSPETFGREGAAMSRRGGKGGGRTTLHQDPLGLLEIAANLKGKGWITLEILGSLGLLGGLALWVSRHYGHLQLPDWVLNEWTKFWSGEP